ncbi:hypothetical protein PIB30_026125 [Stylosanthes scabra]|uniref:Replication factor A C-terminal domain-containing protein n=1 Tax=Stylosanthes scabra TaxID=79078 RepID=A0ABU6UDH3_9FABA|nr:hypothetical protein [Stylosanthes scabra]
MFFRKTSVARLSMDAFPFSPFHFSHFPGVAEMTAARQFHLIDCLGHVVGKEDVVDMVTRNGDATKMMAIYLEDLEGRKMKCTLFGEEMISQFNNYIVRSNGEPVIMVAQLFKPNFYLNETSIQSTFNSSRILFNPNFPEVKQFRERVLTFTYAYPFLIRILALGDIATQGIADVPTQSQNSASVELAGGAICNETIESVMNMHQEKHCWVLGTVVSINCGPKGWYYASCKNCYKKVEDKKDLYKCANCHRLGSKPPLKYRLNVIIADGTGCLNILFWNSEATTVSGKTAREMKDANPDLDGTGYPKMFDSLLEKKVFAEDIRGGEKHYQCGSGLQCFEG